MQSNTRSTKYPEWPLRRMRWATAKDFSRTGRHANILGLPKTWR